VAAGSEDARTVGRYAMHAPLASGGMATVHLGRLLGAVGFSRTVAIKRLHAQYAKDPEFVAMFLDEARLAARIRHANVIPTLDVVTEGEEVFLVMEYAPGESLWRLGRAISERHARLPLRVVSSILVGILHGLHAAHEARDEQGAPLNIVHRDVSPQNVLVGTDGVAKLLDFGVAKAAGRAQFTREGQLKGKLGYMPPEQLRGEAVTRAADLYAVGVVLWELVTGERLFHGDNEGVIVVQVLRGEIPSPFAVLQQRGLSLLPEDAQANLGDLEQLIARAVASDPGQRHTTARELAIALEQAVPPAHAAEVGQWVELLAHDALARRARAVEDLERGPASAGASLTASSPPPAASSGLLSGVPTTGTDLRAQPSSLSVVTRSAPSAPVTRDNPVLAAVVGALVGLFLVGLAVLWRGVRAHGPAAAEGPTAAPLVAKGAGAEATTPAPAPSPLELVTSASAPGLAPALPAPSASVAPAPAAKVAAPTPSAHKPVQHGRVAPPPPKLDCSPPYTTDAEGIRHFKPGCV